LPDRKIKPARGCAGREPPRARLHRPVKMGSPSLPLHN
jgi:hypothetical protein